MSDRASNEGTGAATRSGTRWARRGVLGAVCALVIGVYAWRAQRAYEMMGSGAQENYYNLLVRGIREGHLNVKREAPPELAQPGAAAGLTWSDSVSAGLADLSYYKGNCCICISGSRPLWRLFWPYAALTGHYLSHKDAVVIFLSVGFLAGARVCCARSGGDTSRRPVFGCWWPAHWLLAWPTLRRRFRERQVANGDRAVFQVNCQHFPIILDGKALWPNQENLN